MVSKMTTAHASVVMSETLITSKEETGKKLQRKCLTMISVPPIKIFCYLLLLIFLFVCVAALSVALLGTKREKVIEIPMCTTCPRDWIGFESKCFYFSEDTRNWTSSQAFCLSLDAQLAQFVSLKELNFLRRYMGTSDHWIGLHRQLPQRAWRWTDNTEYNNVAFIRGTGEYTYLTDKGISSTRVNADRKWICSKL